MQHRKNPKVDPRYKTPRWKSIRKKMLAEDPLCKNHAKCKNFASEIDHIVSWRNNDDVDFYDVNNLQQLCKSCHSRKTATEDGAFGNIKHDENRTPYCDNDCEYFYIKYEGCANQHVVCEKHCGVILRKDKDNGKYKKCHTCKKID